jgi:hypothetical protein
MQTQVVRRDDVSVLLIGDCFMRTIKWNPIENAYLGSEKNAMMKVAVEADKIIPSRFKVYSIVCPDKVALQGKSFLERFPMLQGSAVFNNENVAEVIWKGHLSEALKKTLAWPRFDIVIVSGFGFNEINRAEACSPEFIPKLYESLQEMLKLIRADFKVPVIWSEPWHSAPQRRGTAIPGLSAALRYAWDDLIQKELAGMPPWLYYGRIAPKMEIKDFVDEYCNYWKRPRAEAYTQTIGNVLSYIYNEPLSEEVKKQIEVAFAQ